MLRVKSLSSSYVSGHLYVSVVDLSIAVGLIAGTLQPLEPAWLPTQNLYSGAHVLEEPYQPLNG